jgi:hypothetical protein
MANPYEGDSADQNQPGILGTNSANGVGVAGQSDGGSGVTGSSKTWRAVYGFSDQNAGVAGESNAMDGVWAETHGQGFSGVSGRNTHPNGGYGVWGSSDVGRGVAGFSKSGQGVFGQSDTGAGVVGESNESDGVWGVCHSQASAAVSGHNDAGGWAGYFDGGVHVTRDLTVDGDVILANADIAEDFDVADAELERGAVMCIGDNGQLRVCATEYDPRVVGVVSGACELRPGIILGRPRNHAPRVPIALTGRVYCMADATSNPIRPGDQLTTSATAGHAMRADPSRAAGAVLGKALRSLGAGRGLIPILVTLR